MLIQTPGIRQRKFQIPFPSVYPKFALYLNSNDSDKPLDHYQGIFTSGNVFLLLLKLIIVCPSVPRCISRNSCMLKGIVWAYFLPWHPSYKPKKFSPDSIYEPHVTENRSIFIISKEKCGFNITKEKKEQNNFVSVGFHLQSLVPFCYSLDSNASLGKTLTLNLNFYTKTSNWTVSIGYYLFSKHSTLLFSISLISRQDSCCRNEGS